MLFPNAYCTLNGTRVYVTSAEVSESSAEVDFAKMGNNATRTKLGIAQDTITLNFDQDFADANVYALVAAAYANCKSGGTANVAVRPDASASASATNPEFRLAGVFSGYSPFNASHGGKSPLTLVIKPDGVAIVANVG